MWKGRVSDELFDDDDDEVVEQPPPLLPSEVKREDAITVKEENKGIEKENKQEVDCKGEQRAVEVVDKAWGDKIRELQDFAAQMRREKRQEPDDDDEAEKKKKKKRKKRRKSFEDDSEEESEDEKGAELSSAKFFKAQQLARKDMEEQAEKLAAIQPKNKAQMVNAVKTLKEEFKTQMKTPLPSQTLIFGKKKAEDSDIIDLTEEDEEEEKKPSGFQALFEDEEEVVAGSQLQQEEEEEIAAEEQQEEARNATNVTDAEALRKNLLRDYDAMPARDTPPEFLTKLMFYQQQALEWMVQQESDDRVAKGGLLCDEMGLGKTIETLALMTTNRTPHNPDDKRKGTLIVCPLSTLFQWSEEIQNIIKPQHAFSTLLYYGPCRVTSLRRIKKYDIVLTTYGVLQSEYKEGMRKGPLASISWLRVVLDEAHIVKNPKGRTAKAAFELNADRRWCLTGTPIQNSLSDLFSLLHFIRNEIIGDTAAWFNRNVVTPIHQNLESGFMHLQVLDYNFFFFFFKKGHSQIPSKNILYSSMLRRSKDQVIRGKRILTLPACNVERIFVDATPDEKLVYTS